MNSLKRWHTLLISPNQIKVKLTLTEQNPKKLNYNWFYMKRFHEREEVLEQLNMAEMASIQMVAARYTIKSIA